MKCLKSAKLDVNILVNFLEKFCRVDDFQSLEGVLNSVVVGLSNFQMRGWEFKSPPYLIRNFYST